MKVPPPAADATDVPPDLLLESDSEDDDADVVAPVLDVAGPIHLTAPYAVARLDAILADAPALQALALSRSRLKALVEEGLVTVDGVVVTRGSVRLRGGDKLVVTVPRPQPVDLVAEDLPLTLLHDDADLCVVDKPAGLVVHPGAGHATGTLANALLFRFPGLSISGQRRPGIVHRLDKDTSGVLVVAKNDATLQALQAQFVARTVDKRYVAACLGAPGGVGQTLDLQTGHRRAESDRRRFSTKVPPPAAGSSSAVRLAHTAVTTRAFKDGVAVVDVALFTGRTHQIRAHLADRGHPLLQDALYGGGQVERRLPSGAVRDVVVQLRRHALHAASLAFSHPRTGARLQLQSPVPADLAAVIAAVMAAVEAG